MARGDMVQVHMLTAYPASLLNRDDAGLAKRIPFGGAIRTRVSSQCLKKHWRDSPGVTELGDMADRSTRIYEERVARPLKELHSASNEEAAAVARYLMDETVETKAASDESTQSSQLLVLTRAETEWLAEQGAELLARVKEAGEDASDPQVLKKHAKLEDKDTKKRFRSILKELPASVDTALFGRMVTSDLFARVDAAVSVAHAFTTHSENPETDYFTAVDTLKGPDEDAGAGLVQDAELTSGVFYLYTVIDMEQLRSNLGRGAEQAERLARNLVEAMATVSPGAKRGSTAPYAYAELVLVERGDKQPRTLANAFLRPVEANGAGLMAASVDALLEYRGRMEAMYGAFDGAVAVSSVHDVSAGGVEATEFSRALDTVFARP